MTKLKPLNTSSLSSFFQRIYFSRKFPLLLGFSVPFLLTFFVYFGAGLYPLGKLSVLVLDLSAQYIYYLDALRDAVFGSNSFLFSFERAMGGEFMGIFSYYLASPLSFLVCLFPRENITEAAFLIIALKSGLAGLTFTLYLRNCHNTPKYPAVALGTLYAFSGYSLTYQSNLMWMDGVYLLPLLAYGIENLIKKRDIKLYILSLAATLIFNYYIGYMSCIMVFFLFFAIYFSKTPAERHSFLEKAHFLKSLCRIGIATIVGFLLAAFMLIPSYYSLVLGKTTFTTPQYTFTLNYDILRYFYKYFFGTHDTLQPEGLPLLYSGIITLFFVPFFFMSKKVETRKKISLLVLFFLFTAISLFKAPDIVMHGFQAPNWSNCRYSFIFPFLLLTASGDWFAKEKHPPKIYKTGLVLAGLVAFLLVVFFKSEEKNTLYISFIPSLCLVLFYGIVFILQRLPKIHKKVCSILLVSVVAIEALASGYVTLYLLDQDVVISYRQYYANFGKRFTDVVDTIKETDSSPFYRIEKTVSRKLNDNYQINAFGLSGSTSTLNRSQIDFLYNLGYRAESNFSLYDFPHLTTDTLLSVKYVMTDPKHPITEPHYVFKMAKHDNEFYMAEDGYSIKIVDRIALLTKGEEDIPLTTDTDVLVYENPLSLPLGYAASSDVYNITFKQPEIDENGEYLLEDNLTYYSVHEGKTRQAMERLNLLLSAIMGKEVTPYVSQYQNVRYQNVYKTTTYRQFVKEYAKDKEITKVEKFLSDYYKYDFEKEDEDISTVSFTTYGVTGKHLYMYIPCSTHDESKFTVNDVEMGSYLGIYNYGIYDLGEFPGGKKVTVTFTLGDKGLHAAQNCPIFYTLDTSVIEELHTMAESSHFTLETFTEDHLEATVETTKENPVVLFSIPYDTGWNILVDGEKVEPIRALDALLSVKLEPGVHKIQMSYYPQVYHVGNLLSLLGIFAFFGIAILPDLLKKRKQKKEVSHVLLS